MNKTVKPASTRQGNSDSRHRVSATLAIIDQVDSKIRRLKEARDTRHRALNRIHVNSSVPMVPGKPRPNGISQVREVVGTADGLWWRPPVFAHHYCSGVSHDFAHHNSKGGDGRGIEREF